MKVLYSQLIDLIPSLKATPEEVAHTFTMTGFMSDGLEEVSYNKKKDWLISLEVRQNRADSFGVIGLARDLAAYYRLPLQLPAVKKAETGRGVVPIEIKDTSAVERLLAVTIDQVESKKSPSWLQECLEHFGINSINLLVDLSNYVMILTGYPNHIFDVSKTVGMLTWQLNKNRFEKLVTLGGNDVSLTDQTLIVADDKAPLAVAGAIGGEIARVDEKTTAILVELGIYDPALVMRNVRELAISTETSRRLEKNLDSQEAQYAFDLLVQLIQENCGGTVSSEQFDFYPNPRTSPTIEFDPALSSKIAGIEITLPESAELLRALNMDVVEKDARWNITPPTYRTDISLPEDIAEEVIRLHGFEQIPSNETPAMSVVPNITPQLLTVTEQLKDTLQAIGYDETLTLPLLTESANGMTNYLDWGAVQVQNAANEEFTTLRQSLGSGLLNQAEVYLKNGIDVVQIFEIGTCFGWEKNAVAEQEFLALLKIIPRNTNDLPSFQIDVDRILRHLNIIDIEYRPIEKPIGAANPQSAWHIFHQQQPVGVLYKLNPRWPEHSGYFAEINLTAVLGVRKNTVLPVVELTQRLISLDLNVHVAHTADIGATLNKIRAQVTTEKLWNLEVIDVYTQENRTKITVRVTYVNLDDQAAKELHTKLEKSL